jgi:hypothetical protein
MGTVMDIVTFILSKNYTDSVALNGVPINYPQIDPGNQHWKIFNPSSNSYVDTGVVARGVSPKIDGATKNWLVWNESTNAFVDSNILAQGKDGYTPVKGVDYFDGIDGKQIELTNDGTALKWRYMGDAAWVNIIAIADITGTDGESPVLRVYNGVLQYKFPNESVWHNLYTFPVSGEVVPVDLISGDSGNALTTGQDNKLFVPNTGGGSGSGGYTPPPGGIPRNDLSQGVKDSLDKADSALQSNDLSAHNSSNASHTDIRALISNVDRIKSAAYNSVNGDLTFTNQDNSTLTVNFFTANLAKDIGYDSATKKIVITKQDGTVIYVDIADLIDIYIGHNGTQIQTTVETGNVIKAVIKNNSITLDLLEQNLKDAISLANTAIQPDEFDAHKTDPNAHNDTLLRNDETIPNSLIPIATQNTIGGVKPGSGMIVDEHGRLSVNQANTVSYFISSTDLQVGNVGGSTVIPYNSISRISGPNLTPEESDICYTNDGFCLIVQSVNQSMNSVDGIIVTIPPPSAIWSNIQGALQNNQAIPAMLISGGTINIIWLDATDKVQIGSTLHSTNINSVDRLANNNKPVALQEEVTSLQTTLIGEINNEKAERTSRDQGLTETILAEASARTTNDGALQAQINSEIQARTQETSNLSTRLDGIINDSNLESFSTTLSAKEIVNQISKTYQPIPDVPSPDDLPEESNLAAPSICYVDSTQTTWINSKTGNGWKDTGANFATTSDIQNYLNDHGYIKQSQIVDNLLSDDETVPLSARQGKILNALKIGTDAIINNLITDDETKVLSAKMGKWLNDNSLKIADILDSLTSSLTDKALSANQGRILNNKITTLEGFFTDGKANNAVQADLALKADRLSTNKTIKIALAGFANGEGQISTDLSGNPTINIDTVPNSKFSSTADVTTTIYIPQTVGSDGYYRLCTIDSPTTTQSSVHFVFQHAWHGEVEIFIPFFNYNSDLFNGAGISSTYGVRRMPGSFNYDNRLADYKIKWYRTNDKKVEFWIKPNGRNQRAFIHAHFSVNGSISEAAVIWDPNVGNMSYMKSAWPVKSDGYIGTSSEMDTALALSSNGWHYSAAITYTIFP